MCPWDRTTLGILHWVLHSQQRLKDNLIEKNAKRSTVVSDGLPSLYRLTSLCRKNHRSEERIPKGLEGLVSEVANSNGETYSSRPLLISKERNPPTLAKTQRGSRSFWNNDRLTIYHGGY